jgi:hypothetical protein
MIRLGCEVKDTVTGFQGIATAKIEYLYGCIWFEVESQQLQDGKPIEGIFFDEKRLVEVDSPADAESPQKSPPERGGGPQPKGPRRPTPGR